MGFRDLALFNDALLSKQARQLLHNKTSLFYKAFKAHFFQTLLLWRQLNQRTGS